jgi:hypothetical protein
MPNVDRHKTGEFCWFELATTDQPAAKNFYTSLFGWTVEDSPMGPNDFYSMFRLEGRDVGAGYTIRPDQRAQGVPPHWMLYVESANADDAAKRAGELGGKVIAPPFDVFDIGRMTVLADPTGGIFSVWQAKKHSGTGITGVNGTACWADLSTPDPGKAGQFYSGLFGWQLTRDEKDPSGYLHIKNGEEFIGGIPPAHLRNPDAPPHWLIYFLVESCDASAAKAKDLRAQHLLPPQSIPKVGRMSIVKDPQGAVFALFQPESR